MAPSIALGFDHESHTYYDRATRERFPHVTGLLKQEGLVDATYYTEESRVRGTAVHLLTAEYDLGALDPASCVSPYRGYLLAHVKGMQRMLRPQFEYVEVPFVHPLHRFGGKPDRVGRVFKAVAVYEIKSGAATKAHPIQTALQAILVSDAVNLPPQVIKRYCEYVREDGRVRVEEHTNPFDFDKAFEMLWKWAR